MVIFSAILILSDVAVAASLQAPQVVAVSATFDNAPFKYQIEQRAERHAFRVYRLTYPSPVRTSVEQNNTVPAELYLPKGIEPGAPKRPAVICLHILDGNVELVEIACSALASRGIPAAWFSLPYYGERALPGGRRAMAADPELFTRATSQAMQDVRRTVDVLASRPEIDPQRIGVMGISLGGILAATAAENDPRVFRAALILAGGDLPAIIHHARETKELSDTLRSLPPTKKTEIERTINDLDPLRHADRLRERARAGKVLMINAAADEVIPRLCTEKLAAALGMSDRVVWLDGLGHYTALAALPQTLRATADFFAQDLPPGVKPAEPAGKARTPERVVVSLLQQAGDLLVAEPKLGRCHLVDLEVSADRQGGKKIDGRLRIVRGAKSKFSIYCKLTGLGEATVGHADYPWMASGERVVFKGVLPPDAKSSDPLPLADPKQLVKLQVVSGALAALAMAPDILERWVTITDDTSADKTPAIRIVRKGQRADCVRLALHDDRSTPRSATFDVEGVRGAVTFRAWQFNTVAHESMFQEPAGLPVQQVDRTDLLRMFAAMFNFAMESFK